MNARLTGAALWAAVSCLPQSDDLGAYSAEWSPDSAAGAGDGSVAGASSAAAGAAGAASAGSGSSGSDGVVGGGSLPLDGMGGAAASGAGTGGALAAMGGSAGGPADDCADGTLSADGARCYIVSSTGAAWSDARDECAGLQSELVKVETAEEDALIATLLGVNLWLGASDTVAENVFVWSDGTPIEFGNWGPAQPDRFPGPDCVEKRDTAGRQWFDQPCDNERAFVCERALQR